MSEKYLRTYVKSIFRISDKACEKKNVSWWGLIDHSSEAYPVTHGFGIIIHSMAMG